MSCNKMLCTSSKTSPSVHSAITPVDSSVHQSNFECKLILLFLPAQAYLKVNQGVTVRPV